MFPRHVISDYKIIRPISVLLGRERGREGERGREREKEREREMTRESHLPVLPPSDKVGVLH